MIKESSVEKVADCHETMFTKYKVLFNQGQTGDMLLEQGYMNAD